MRERETADFPVWNGETFLHQTERGQLRMWLVAPSVLLMDYRGYSDQSFMGFIEDVWARTLDGAQGPLRVFGDTEHQTGFDHSFRAGMASWSRHAVPRSDIWCLLVKSRWIAMGIALVRTTLGGPSRHIEVTTSRERFHERIDTAIRRHRPYELIRGEGGAARTAANDAAFDDTASSEAVSSEASGRFPASSGDDYGDR
ncbi:MAG TPA: hypothetical protein VMG12_24480 [Polyangiaceae bacterium]|nr:hypothetical protein [Polyangiaceae bacterium]